MLLTFFKNYKRQIQLLMAWNKQFFPHVLVFTYAALLIEVATYTGFISKHFLISTTILVGISIVSFLLANIEFSHRRGGKVSSRLSEVVILLNQLATLPILMIYYILVALEEANFPNYVFSRGINIQSITTILTLNVSIILIYFLIVKRLISFTHDTHTFLGTLSRVKVMYILYILAILYFFVPQIQAVITNIYSSNVRVVHALNDTYDEKMIRSLGGQESSGWVYLYGQFVSRHTEPDAVILIPPQLQSWEMEGNPWYFRWFIYPRKILSSRAVELVIPEETEYVLIAHGTWVWGATDFGWPKESIPAEMIERIILIDRTTLEETVITDQDYELQVDPQQWGIIKLRKGAD